MAPRKTIPPAAERKKRAKARKTAAASKPPAKARSKPAAKKRPAAQPAADDKPVPMIEAALGVLAQASPGFMQTTQAIWEEMERQGLTAGIYSRTPERSLYTALLRESRQPEPRAFLFGRGVWRLTDLGFRQRRKLAAIARKK